jgi:hypothetical protein
MRNHSEEFLKRWKLRQEQLLNQVDQFLKAFHKQCLRDERLIKKATYLEDYDNIGEMDYSVKQSFELWITLIAMAKRDFIMYYTHPDRWDIKTFAGKTFVMAYGFLFRDDYKISIDIEECPKCEGKELDKVCSLCSDQGYVKSEQGKEINLRELLEQCIDVGVTHGLNVSVIEPSVDHLRERLAKEIGDPVLIKKFGGKIERSKT